MTKVTLITAFNWFSNALDIENLNASEQIVMLHILKIMNRNFWKPIKINPYKFAKNTGHKDYRTIKTALNSLIKKGLLYDLEGEYYIGIEPEKVIRTVFGKLKVDNADTSANLPESQSTNTAVSYGSKLSDYI